MPTSLISRTILKTAPLKLSVCGLLGAHHAERSLRPSKKIYPDWKDKYGVEIVAINVDSERMLKRAKALYDSNGWDYTFLHADQKQLIDALGITSIPYSILVDGDGNIRSTQNGYHPGYEKELEAKLRKL